MKAVCSVADQILFGSRSAKQKVSIFEKLSILAARARTHTRLLVPSIHCGISLNVQTIRHAPMQSELIDWERASTLPPCPTLVVFVCGIAKIQMHRIGAGKGRSCTKCFPGLAKRHRIFLSLLRTGTDLFYANVKGNSQWPRQQRPSTQAQIA